MGGSGASGLRFLTIIEEAPAGKEGPRQTDYYVNDGICCAMVCVYASSLNIMPFHQAGPLGRTQSFLSRIRGATQPKEHPQHAQHLWTDSTVCDHSTAQHHSILSKHSMLSSIAQCTAQWSSLKQTPTMQVRMHVCVSLAEVSLDQQLILLSITSANDEVVLAADEPMEALKPKGLAHCC